jgi:prepilin-type processing-associated H-X9-DG protein
MKRHLATTRSKLPAGFSLVECLVIIMVLAVLVALVVLGIQTAKARALSTQCLNNNRQLCAAWLMYAQENTRLVNNFDKNEMWLEYSQQRFANWVNGMMDWSLNEQNTNITYIVNSPLYHYAGSARFYRCPADKYLSPKQHEAGWAWRARSFSMNGFLGSFVERGRDKTAGGRNPFDADYRQFLKLYDIAAPAETYVFIEEQADSIGDGYFWVNDQGWADIPGAYHRGSGNLSYADGHSALQQWRSRKAVVPVTYQAGKNWHPTDPEGEEDLNWLKRHGSVPVR